jgi:hypothetical protein
MDTPRPETVLVLTNGVPSPDPSPRRWGGED